MKKFEDTSRKEATSKDQLLTNCEDSLREMQVELASMHTKMQEAAAALDLPSFTLFGEELPAEARLNVPLEQTVVVANVLITLEKIFSGALIPLKPTEKRAEPKKGFLGVLQNIDMRTVNKEITYKSDCGGIVARVNPETQQVVALNMYDGASEDNNKTRLSTSFDITSVGASATFQSGERVIDNMFHEAATLKRTEVRAMLDDFVLRNIKEA